jgi:hypothetical protein
MRQNEKMELKESEQPLYIVIDNSMLIYRIERYDEQKNIAGLILYKNLTDFTGLSSVTPKCRPVNDELPLLTMYQSPTEGR